MDAVHCLAIELTSRPVHMAQGTMAKAGMTMQLFYKGIPNFIDRKLVTCTNYG